MKRARILSIVLRAPAVAATAALVVVASAYGAPGVGARPLKPIPSLDVASYMGRWYQVAWVPNRFQSQCVSDTTAVYRTLPQGDVEVLNRCRKADGSFEEALGRARASGRIENGQLVPATLEVSFLPSWLRWLPVGWGDYWVIQRADDGRYAVISEGTREFLWVLSRTPTLAPADESAIRSRLLEQGFDLRDLKPHPQALQTQ